MTTDALLTTKAVAGLLSCSPRMVRKLVGLGQLPARRLGSELRFDAREVEAFRHSLPRVGKPQDLRSTSLRTSAMRGSREARRARHLKEMLP